MTTINEALNDEITSINSIYEPKTLSSTSNASLYTLKLPSQPSISLRVEFPPDYPDAPPSILGTETVGDDVSKGVGKQVVDVVSNVLAEVYRPGEACIFDLLEEVREALEEAEEQGGLNIHEHHNGPQPETHDSTSISHEAPQLDLGPEPPWTIAPPIAEKKSIFLARITPVSSPLQAKTYLAQLLATDKKVARATHNITAWRIRGPNDTSYQDCDDDGESAAGGRVLHLMQLMDVWDVMIVVTRWYGGVLLGPDRFRIINTAAREALVLGGFGKEGGSGKGKDAKKGKK
ncbi:impact family protein [Lophiotrema nucula]|uniref:Impact family protein n=1 Tax=Lophiotrema nucula TaxID=690887 RepID=A0A6A5Z279_9PLEO|nr:impact family protein [Lophiotrema nucula]